MYTSILWFVLVCVSKVHVTTMFPSTWVSSNSIYPFLPSICYKWWTTLNFPFVIARASSQVLEGQMLNIHRSEICEVIIIKSGVIRLLFSRVWFKFTPNFSWANKRNYVSLRLPWMQLRRMLMWLGNTSSGVYVHHFW